MYAERQRKYRTKGIHHENRCNSTIPRRTQPLTTTRIPALHPHTRLLGVTGIGWALDAMDVGLISFIMAALTKQWALSPTETSWLGSIGFLGMALGATVGGLLADRFGRRYVFAATLLIYGLATGASALAGSLAVLMVFRFIVGLGLGAELPVASTLMSEFFAARYSRACGRYFGGVLGARMDSCGAYRHLCCAEPKRLAVGACYRRDSSTVFADYSLGNTRIRAVLRVERAH